MFSFVPLSSNNLKQCIPEIFHREKQTFLSFIKASLKRWGADLKKEHCAKWQDCLYIFYRKSEPTVSHQAMAVLVFWQLSLNEIYEIISSFPDRLKTDQRFPFFMDKFVFNQISEAKFNISLMKKSTSLIELKFNPLKSYKTKNYIKEFSINGISSKLNLFPYENEILIPIPIHPYNTSCRALGFIQENIDDRALNEMRRRIGALQARPTASRTLYVEQNNEIDSDILGLKLPTNHINNEKSKRIEQDKTDLFQVTILTSYRNRLINEINKKYKLDPLNMEECGAFVLHENGYIVKNINLLKEKLLIPAFSIPIVGKIISDFHHSNSKLKSTSKETYFLRFWGAFYARKLGILKAQLLLRYGLQFHIPNPQNLLVVLSDKLIPERIIFRDLGDLMMHKPVAQAYDDMRKWLRNEERLSKYFTIKKKQRISLFSSQVYLAWRHSVMWFEISDFFQPFHSDINLSRKWPVIYITAYISEIEKELSVKIDIPFKFEEYKEFGSLAHGRNSSTALSKNQKELLKKWTAKVKQYYSQVNLDRHGFEPGKYPAYFQHILHEAYSISLSDLLNSAFGIQILKAYRKKLSMNALLEP